MHSYSALFPLLAVSLLNGEPVHSNSPHSPYTQLKVLTEDVNSLKGTLERLKLNEDISETLLSENKQLTFRIEQLENENKKLQNIPEALLSENKQLTSRIEQLENENRKLQDQLKDLDEVYKKQTQDLLALSKDFQHLRSKTKESNANAIKNRDLVSVKKDISQIKESLSSTQHEMGDFEKRLADDGARNSQNLQEQLQRVKSELLEFCQSTNRKLQDFSEQMKNNLTKVTHNGCVKHTIASGESLASIARMYRTTPDRILSANHLEDTRGLHVGDAILVPQEVF